MEKKLFQFLFLILVQIFFNTSFLFSNKLKYKSIDEFVKKEKIKIKIFGIGGYQGNCIKFDISNKTSDTLFIRIEPGRKLISEDTTIQDILIIKEQLITLLPKASLIRDGYGFCCESSMSSPYKNSKFDIGVMSSQNIVKLAEFLNENRFPISAMQSAIWVFSNNHQISSIIDDDEKKVRPLKEFVANLLGIEIPWYSITYAKDTARVFSDKALLIYGIMKFKIQNNCIVTITVRDNNGMLVETIAEELSYGPGNYFYNVNLNINNWLKGKYTIFIHDDSKLNTKADFEI